MGHVHHDAGGDAGADVVRAQFTIVNQSETSCSAAVDLAISDASGRVIQTVKSSPESAPPGSSELTVEAVMDKPSRWDIDNPALYQALLTLGTATL